MFVAASPVTCIIISVPDITMSDVAVVKSVFSLLSVVESCVITPPIFLNAANSLAPYPKLTPLPTAVIFAFIVITESNTPLKSIIAIVVGVAPVVLPKLKSYCNLLFVLAKLIVPVPIEGTLTSICRLPPPFIVTSLGVMLISDVVVKSVDVRVTPKKLLSVILILLSVILFNSIFYYPIKTHLYIYTFEFI